MPQLQMTQYIPVLMLGALAILFAFGMLLLSVALGKKGRRTPAKDTPYECGMPPVGEGRTRFSIKFYVVAMLFLLFDVEAVFVIAWAAVYKDLLRVDPGLIFGSMISFLLILAAGYLYALKKGAFDWKT
jgi:NADH-quinone oxidoreductase subunit A